MAAKSLRDLNQKYRGKPKKYAEGGRARRPAAAPVPRPSDEDYLSILADRAVGAGEPVPELRSAEGRGFAPTPFQGEGFQRMSAMLRGEVEPTPGEQMGLNIVRGFTEGPASIRAYHGSPHRFERFDISKIGTGEGATAYGRGLYFAGAEPVARRYRDQSVGRRLIGGENPNFSRFDHYASSMDQMYGSRAKAIKAIKENAENGFGVDVAADAIRLLRSKQKLPEISYSPGHMYEVRLRTTPEELVNWDAPLVRQPERAVPFLEDVLRAPRTGSARVLEREMKPIGEAIDLRTPEIAAQLREAGIPGLRYLDAGSRTGRQNTRNYVMFGDDLIDITRRYAEGGLAELDQKYAEGGRARRPASAPVPRPSDEDYLSILADRAVGAGEPVAELRSAEGRGFAPMPRSFGEAGQRMSAMVRGAVEPTPEEERQINAVRGFTEGPASIRAYHGSPYRFRRFDISKAGSTTDEGQLGRALYFSTDKAGVERLNAQGAPVWPVRYEVDLQIENPLQLKLPFWFADKRRLIREELNLPMDASAKEVAQKIISRGHDSVSLDYSPVKYYHQELGVFDPDLINLVRRYEEGGMVREPATAYDPDEIDRIVQEFAEGGEVEAPAKTYIGGQEHKLAYITDREAALLKARGGSGRMTKHGIRAYDEGPGEGPGSDNANSMSEAATQDAVGGNQGQGAGPTGAGAGGGPGQGNQGMSNADPEGTEQAANMNTAVAAQEAGRGFGIADTGGVAPTGFNAAPGIAEAIGALGRGEIGFGQALGYGVQSAMSPPGMQVGVNVDELGNQTPAVSVSALGVVGGLMGLATGIPGAGAIGGMIGNEIGKELGLDPTVMSYEPGVFNAPEPTPAYGAAGYGMDYGRGYAHGGLAKLHAKYAGGGSVSAYDPRAVDQLAKQIEAQYV